MGSCHHAERVKWIETRRWKKNSNSSKDLVLMICLASDESSEMKYALLRVTAKDEERRLMDDG